MAFYPAALQTLFNGLKKNYGRNNTVKNESTYSYCFNDFDERNNGERPEDGLIIHSGDANTRLTAAGGL